MKKVFKAVAYCCGAVMGYAASMWDAGVCSGMMLVMVLLAMGICICVCLHELAVIKEYERKKKRPSSIALGRPSLCERWTSRYEANEQDETRSEAAGAAHGH